MLRFDFLSDHGAALACISERADGDCGWRADVPRAAYLHACGVVPEHLASVRQVHGRDIAVISEDGRGCGANMAQLKGAPLADGMVTNVAGLPLGITVADCVPVFLVAPQAIGLVHAGREGTRLGIAPAAVEALEAQYGVDPASIWALVGPSAGPCCYEVSEEMAEAWRAEGLPAQGRFLDLWEANRRLLTAANVPDQQIQVAGHCTICQHGYHSFRRDGGTARNLAMLCR